MPARLDPLSIYVAASGNEIETAERWMHLLRLAGWDVKSTWPELIRSESGGESNPLDASPEQRAKWGRRDATEVGESHVLWLLMPAEYSHGAFWEFGYAHGRRIYTVVSGAGLARSVFTALADTVVEGPHEEAFAHLARLRKEGIYR